MSTPPLYAGFERLEPPESGLAQSCRTTVELSQCCEAGGAVVDEIKGIVLIPARMEEIHEVARLCGFAAAHGEKVPEAAHWLLDRMKKLWRECAERRADKRSAE